MEAVAVMAAASLAVGFVVGVLSGLLGVGGGMFLVPIFKLGYLMDSLMCTATSLFTIIPTSISGAVSRIRNRTCVPKLGIAAGLGGAVTSPLGVWLATQSPDWAIMGTAALVIAYSATTMFRKALAVPKGAAPQKRGAGKGNSADAPADGAPNAAASGATPETADSSQSPAIIDGPVDVGRRQLLLFAGIGLVAGLASGYVGVGGGFLMVPMMISLAHLSMRYTSGTSLIAVMILAVPGVVTQAVLGNINWIAGIAVACGSVPGAMLGARLVPKVPERQLRFLFAGFLLVAAVMLVVNQFAAVA